MQERYLFLQDSQSADLCYLKKNGLKVKTMDSRSIRGGGGWLIAFI